jgi:tryptophan halogenase
MKKIIVVGAGAAGNFVSSAIKRNRPDLDVTLIYDPKTPVVGVGEALQFNASRFMSKVLGFKRDIDWIKQSRSIFRVGTKFQGWDNTDTVFYSNHTSIPSMDVLNDFKSNGINGLKPLNQYTTPGQDSMLDVWLYLKQSGYIDKLEYRTPKDLYAGHSSQSYWYSRNNRLPYNLHTGEWTHPRGMFGYCINAIRVGTAIQELIGKPAGVKELPIAIKDVVLKANGDIDYLLLDDDSHAVADLYFDCTGFAKVLCKKLPFKFKHLDDSFNDRCIVGPHRFVSDTERTSNAHIQAMDQGWHFSVPMDVRSGEGYVFNSRHTTNVESLTDEYYSKTGKRDVDFRLISWEPGYQEKAFVNNCISIGLSHGLIDAYDANAFSTALGKIEFVVDQLLDDTNLDLAWKDKFNEYADMRMEDTLLRIRFAFHLCKKETPYWENMRAVGRSLNSQDKLYELINGTSRKNIQDEKNNKFLWPRGVWISQATYYDLPVKSMIKELDVDTQMLAIDYFNQLGKKFQGASLTGIPSMDFYKMLYPLDK